jgi:hypothetical protein
MRPITVTVGPVGTTSPTNIAASQTPGAAGALTLSGALVSGGVATLPTPQRVLITTTDTTTVFTITGTTPTGSALTETVKGGGSNVTSQLDYSTVTSIRVNQGTTAAVTVGTSGAASTPWVRLDEWANSECSIQCNVTGTVNYTVQVSNDDPNSITSPILPSAMTWLPTNDPTVVGATASQQSNFFFSPTFTRVLLNSGAGSVTATFTQFNVASR